MSSATAHPDPEDTPVLKLVLQQNRQAPSLARAAVSAFCENREMTDAVLATVALLVSEVVTNAVIHPKVRSPANIQLLARVEPNLLRIEVIDDGSGFVPAPRDASRVGSGYGLFLLGKQAQRWGVDQSGGTRVWFEVGI